MRIFLNIFISPNSADSVIKNQSRRRCAAWRPLVLAIVKILRPPPLPYFSGSSRTPPHPTPPSPPVYVAHCHTGVQLLLRTTAVINDVDCRFFVSFFLYFSLITALSDMCFLFCRLSRLLLILPIYLPQGEYFSCQKWTENKSIDQPTCYAGDNCSANEDSPEILEFPKVRQLWSPMVQCIFVAYSRLEYGHDDLIE